MLDKDFYRFSTTIQKPNIMVTLNHDLLDCDLSLYRLEPDNSLTLLANNNTRIQGLERIIWNSSVASNYILVVRNQIRNINIDSCYNIRVEASDTNFVTKSMELISSSGFIMYPNPNHDVLTIVLSNEQEQNMIIDISDSFGRKILHQEVENNIVNLSTSNWAKGIYFVTLRQKSRIFTQKLIVD